MISKIAITVASLKKEPFSGSHHGMRFYMKKSDEGFDVWTYPEPWCFEQTPEEDKTKNTFPLTAEGLEEAMAWLNQCFDANQEKWEDIEKNKMQILLRK
ncbi:MAG: GNAT family acetyltransferase [Dorea sp.]|nr:GNAT family acetyltransferase [Dorea sp.]